MKQYVIGFVLGASTVTGGAVLAAVGDFIYEANDSAYITGTQAAEIADQYIAKGAWTGVRTEISQCTIARVTGGPTPFLASCGGTKTSAPASLPIGTDGVHVIGRVE